MKKESYAKRVHNIVVFGELRTWREKGVNVIKVNDFVCKMLLSFGHENLSRKQVS